MRNSIFKPFKILWQAIVIWWDSWLDMFVINLIVLLCWVTVVLGPPATFGLYAIIREYLEEGTSSGLRGLWTNAKKFAWRSYLWFGVNVLIFGVTNIAFFFYMNMGQAWSIALGWVLLLICVGWFFFVQFYTISFLMEQEKVSLRLAWRNATLATLAWPYFALVLVLVVNLLGAVGIFTIAGLFFFIPVLPAIISTVAVRDRLEILTAIQRKSKG